MHRPRWMALVLGAAAIAVTAYVLLRPRYEHVWQAVASLPESVNTPGQQEYEPNITPDGDFLIFTRGEAGNNADLYIAPLGDNGIGDAVPLDGVNTEYDEIDGMLGTDGNLYFYSNRPGGLGGFDLYSAARLRSGTFGTATNLGANVNSRFNDYDPCLSHDGKFLYFSSNRHSAGSEDDYDLYVCLNRDSRWTTPRPLDALNTEHNEWEPMLDRRGRVLYFASNRPRILPDGTERHDYDLYATAFQAQAWRAPQNLGEHVNSADDEFDPCVSPKSDGLFYVRGTRSGAAYDVDIWEGSRLAICVGPILQPGRIPASLVTVLALLVACLALFFLLAHWWSRLTTLQKCMLGSLAVHCLVMWIFTLVTMRLAPDDQGPKEATFIIYTELSEDVQREALVAAMFEDKRPLAVSEAPHRPLDVPDVVPDFEEQVDVLEQEIARPEPKQDSMEWQMPPAELTELSDSEQEHQDVSEAIDENAGDVADMPTDALPLSDLSDVVAERASIPVESVDPATFSAEIEQVDPVREDDAESKQLAEMAMAEEDPSEALADAAEQVDASTPRRGEKPLAPVEVATAAPRDRPQEDGSDSSLVLDRPERQAPSELTAPDYTRAMKLAALQSVSAVTVNLTVEEIESSPGEPSVPKNRELSSTPSAVPAALAAASLQDGGPLADLAVPKSAVAQLTDVPNSGGPQELVKIDVTQGDGGSPAAVDMGSASPDLPVGPVGAASAVPVTEVAKSAAVSIVSDATDRGASSAPPSRSAKVSRSNDRAGPEKLSDLQAVQDAGAGATPTREKSVAPALPSARVGGGNPVATAAVAKSAAVSTVSDATDRGASSAPPSRSAEVSRSDDHRAGSEKLADLQPVQEAGAGATLTTEKSVAPALPSAPAGAASEAPATAIAKSAAVSTVSAAADPGASSAPSSPVANLSRSEDHAGAAELADLQAVQDAGAGATPTREQSVAPALPSAPTGEEGTVPATVVAESASVSTVGDVTGRGESSALPSRSVTLSRGDDGAGVAEFAELQAVEDGEPGVAAAVERSAAPTVPSARLAVSRGASVGDAPQVGLPPVAVSNPSGGAPMAPSALPSGLVTPAHSAETQVVELAASVSPVSIQPIASAPIASPRVPAGTPQPRLINPPLLLTPAQSALLPRVANAGADNTLDVEQEKTAVASTIPGGKVARIAWGQASNLGPAVNSAADESAPSQTADGFRLFLTRAAEGTNADVHVSPMAEHGWDPPAEFTAVNTGDDEIGVETDASGLRVVFCSDRPDGVGGYDLYMSERTGGQWQAPTGLGAVVNSEYDDCDPCLSSDGQWLFFSSNRGSKGAEKNHDLYVCQRADGATWGQPVRLLINTGEDEREPAVSADGLSLYFSSNRPGGEGGYDIWMSSRMGGGWLPPANLGGGVNTENEERDPAMTPDDTILLFTTNRDGGEGGFDIWEAKRTLVMGE